jgi:hypothetical protein
VIGRQERWQEDLFVACPLSSLVPDDHILKRVDAILDLSWLPDHSSLTRIRQRWGMERFKQIFQRIVRPGVDAGLVGGKTVHIDATLILS